jgi:hypothetical protein
MTPALYDWNFGAATCDESPLPYYPPVKRGKRQKNIDRIAQKAEAAQRFVKRGKWA